MKQHAKTKAYMGKLRFRRSLIPSNRGLKTVEPIRDRNVVPGNVRADTFPLPGSGSATLPPSRQKEPLPSPWTGKSVLVRVFVVASGGVADEFIDTAG